MGCIFAPAFLFFSLLLSVSIMVLHVQENLIRDDGKLILLASLSDSLEYVADSIERQVPLMLFIINEFVWNLNLIALIASEELSVYCDNEVLNNRFLTCRLSQMTINSSSLVEESSNNKKNPHSQTNAPPKDLGSFADEYRKLAVDCLKVLHMEMLLETILQMQVCQHDFAPKFFWNSSCICAISLLFLFF